MAIPVKFVERNKYSNYLKKATELYDSMMDAYRQERWNATIINAVHCAISASDAYVVFKRGEISIRRIRALNPRPPRVRINWPLATLPCTTNP